MIVILSRRSAAKEIADGSFGVFAPQDDNRLARIIRMRRAVSYATVVIVTHSNPQTIPAPTSLIQCTPR